MAIPRETSSSISIGLGDEAATRRLAEACAALARPGDVFALWGPMGAGKTTFARAFVNAVAARTGSPPEEVPSPTFTLVQVYEFPGLTVWHVDLYRIEDARAVVELGLDDAFAEGVTLVEWPDRLGNDLPRERLDVALDMAAEPEERRCRLSGSGMWAMRAEALRPNG